MAALMEFACRDTPPFRVEELAAAASGWIWGILGSPAKQHLVNSVRRLLMESTQNQLKGYLKQVTNDGRHWELDYHAVLGARTHEVRSAFGARCREYVRWKRSTRGQQEALF
jgi:hypothetical protein